MRFSPWFFLFLILPLGACSTVQTSEPQVRREHLAVVEYAFQSALKAVEIEVLSGRLTGKRAGEVRVAVEAAKIALDAARASGDRGKLDLNLVASASLAVATIIELYQRK